MVAHEVWATTSDKTKNKLIATYEEDRWQWAVKLRAFLIEEGYKDVKIVNVEKREKQCQKTK